MYISPETRIREFLNCGMLLRKGDVISKRCPQTKIFGISDSVLLQQANGQMSVAYNHVRSNTRLKFICKRLPPSGVETTRRRLQWIAVNPIICETARPHHTL